LGGGRKNLPKKKRKLKGNCSINNRIRGRAIKIQQKNERGDKRKTGGKRDRHVGGVLQLARDCGQAGEGRR